MYYYLYPAICFWCFKKDNFCPLYEKSKGGSLSPPGKFQNVNHFRILSFKMETLNRPSFNEIGEMTCITLWLSPLKCRVWYKGQPLVCDICSNNHKAADCLLQGKCRRCHQAGHFVWDSPKPVWYMLGREDSPTVA